MATPVIMPRQGQSVESCIITEWKKRQHPLQKLRQPYRQRQLVRRASLRAQRTPQKSSALIPLRHRLPARTAE